MDAERRKQLEERRRFMRVRLAAKARRQAIEPALSALEAAGETFRLYHRGQTPDWSPRWIPSGYSYIPWRELSHVNSRRIDDRATMTSVLLGLLAERLAPADELLFVAMGKGWSVGLLREGFERHIETLLDAAWDRVYIAAPPVQWLICADWAQVIWKDG